MILLLLFACSSHHVPPPEPCRESAVLPDVGERYECPSPATVAVHDAAEGPVVLCLCTPMEAP